MGGSAVRLKMFAEIFSQNIGYSISDNLSKSDRFSMWKTGPVIWVNVIFLKNLNPLSLTTFRKIILLKENISEKVLLFKISCKTSLFKLKKGKDCTPTLSSCCILLITFLLPFTTK